MFSQSTYFATPAYPLEEVFDPTGAGDSFAGGFMGYLSSANSSEEAAFRQAVIYGSVMASFHVEDFGCARLRKLTHDEINERFRALRSISHFDVSDLPPPPFSGNVGE